MRTKIKSTFYLRKSKVNNLGLIPIYQKIFIDDRPFDCSTGIFVLPADWSKETYRIKGNLSETKLKNKHLEELQNKISEIEKKLYLTYFELNFENFKNEFKGIKPKNRTLIPIFQDHNSKIKELVGQEYASGTLERYETSLKHTIDFLKWKFNFSDIDITKIDHSFITEYEFYLRSIRKCANNTAVKYIKNFKKIIRLCLANGWLDKDPFVNYKSKLKEVIREYLTEQEIQAILHKTFPSLPLDSNSFETSSYSPVSLA